MSTVLDQAKTAVSLVRENKTIVQVGTQRRSDLRHQQGAKLIQSGVLGTVSEVEAAWHDAAPRWARPYDDVREEDVDWEQYLMFLPKEPFNAARFRRWHLYKDFTSGTPALLGSHLIDVATWFMDDPLPSSVVAHGGIYVWKDGREHADTMDCILEYPKGFIVNYSTRLGNKHLTPEVVFYGTKGTFDTESWTARGEGGGDGRDHERDPHPEAGDRPATRPATQQVSPAMAMSQTNAAPQAAPGAERSARRRRRPREELAGMHPLARDAQRADRSRLRALGRQDHVPESVGNGPAPEIRRGPHGNSARINRIERKYEAELEREAALTTPN